MNTDIKFDLFLVRGLNTAKQIVEYCESQPMFRQSIQAKFLNATTTRRLYYNLTSKDVDRVTPKQLLRARSVKPLEGERI